ncbi:MAG: DUF5615 family PIN-like protein [Gaiellales bacterium]
MIIALDEMFSPEIARQLRDRGHDAISVHERADLRGAPDGAIFSAMQREQRVIVTNNHGHFATLLSAAIADDEPCHGALFTADRSLPRSKSGIPLLVATLDAYLAEHAGTLVVPGTVAWLGPTV